MTFPGAHASVYYNEAGEVLGWDYPDDGPYEPDDYLPDYDDDYGDAEDVNDDQAWEDDIRTWDKDLTHTHDPGCNSLTCYQAYLEAKELGHVEDETDEVMSPEAWADDLARRRG